MKKIIGLAVLSCLFAMYANAQFKVLADGSVRITSTCDNWEKAISTTVTYPEACAYHLTFNGADVFYTCAEGWIWSQHGQYCGSDIKLKKNIKPIFSALRTIKLLNGVEFNYKNDSIPAMKGNTIYQKSGNNNICHLGLIAQDVEKVIPGMVKDMPDGTKALPYSELIALLIEGMKEQQATIDSLKHWVNVMDSILNKYINKVGPINKPGLGNSNDVNTNNYQVVELSAENMIILNQNDPNPFAEETDITYYLPETVNNAKIMFYDNSGNIIKAIELQGNGNGTLHVYASNLSSGMYTYALIVDGKLVESKKMNKYR